MARNRYRKIVARKVDSLIQRVREERIILDSDLASIYGVSTKRLNEQVKRNRRRFPEDFCFRLTMKELDELKTVHKGGSAGTGVNRSQNATGSRRNLRFRPYAFTEHGAIMAANILSSTRATRMSIFVVRSFVRIRQTLELQDDLRTGLKNLKRGFRNASTRMNGELCMSLRRSENSGILRYSPRQRNARSASLGIDLIVPGGQTVSFHERIADATEPNSRAGGFTSCSD